MPTGKLLTLLALPQRWNGAELALRVVALPNDDPLTSLVADAPAFADAALSFEAMVVPSLARLPDPTEARAPVPLATAAPSDARAVLEAVAAQFTIGPTPAPQPRPPGTRIRKWLPPSYQTAFDFAGRRTPFAVTDDSYQCALAEHPVRPPVPRPAVVEITWARALAYLLRQPSLAERAGLIFETRLAVSGLEDGGWIWVGLAAGSAFSVQAAADAALVGTYAARLPPLGATARPIFAPVVFPVSSGPPPGPPAVYDEATVEAERYDDGFAEVVHCYQPRTAGVVAGDPVRAAPTSDVGVRVGWDDEQLAIWMNRQLATDPADPTALIADAPLTVRAYRIDVREVGGAPEADEEPWHSLVAVEGDLRVGALDLGSFSAELGVEAVPLQLGGRVGDYWLPSYFSAWAGGSLVVPDVEGLRLSGHPSPPQPLLRPVGADAVPLRYGGDYELRVRLVDVSGGGPSAEDAPVNWAPAPVARCRFRRWVPPKALAVAPWAEVEGGPVRRYVVHRPLLGYPDALFADAPDARAALMADVPAAREEGRAPGTADPDVDAAWIAVDVAAPHFDVNPGDPAGDGWIRLSTTLRSLPAALDEPLVVDVEFVDVADVAELAAPAPGEAVPADGPLVLPTARDVRLTFASVGRDDPTLAYFGADAVRLGGPAVTLRTRAPSSDERSLFAPAPPGEQLRGVWLRRAESRDGLGDAVRALAVDGQGETPQAIARLADALRLDADGLALSTRPGRRTTFGCSGALRHLLAPDASSIALASQDDLHGHWIVAVSVDLARDWTWDGLAPDGVVVERDGVGVLGSVRLPRTVSETAVAAAGADGNAPLRSSTRLVFLDAVDPKPLPGQHPRELEIAYTLRPVFRDEPAQRDDPLQLACRLPVAVQPRDAPRLASVGWALSEYWHAPDYGATEHREQRLWLELDAPPADPDDALFARVLAYAPDPMLAPETEVTLPDEPPLPVDPELVRTIVPGQSDDRAGLNAMELLPTASPTHFLLPLPRGLGPAACELLGFFTYELRFGHARRWTTAQARFGPPLRVTGVQHPPPPLDCHAFRDGLGITATAAFARPVHDGRSARRGEPTTQLWVLLYAQATQLDGLSQRNVLLDRRRAWPADAADEQVTLDILGAATWQQREVTTVLHALRLAPDSPLSVMAVELLPTSDAFADPLGADLGHVRVLRVSPLTRVPAVC